MLQNRTFNYSSLFSGLVPKIVVPFFWQILTKKWPWIKVSESGVSGWMFLLLRIKITKDYTFEGVGHMIWNCFSIWVKEMMLDNSRAFCRSTVVKKIFFCENLDLFLCRHEVTVWNRMFYIKQKVFGVSRSITK